MIYKNNNLEDVLRRTFLDYAAFIAQRRALPDARDGLKYTARQIIDAQRIEKLDHKHKMKKSQKSVAAATSHSYVHGDGSAYEQIIRMGRNLVQRYFFEELQGNKGTPCSSTDYSQMRYTEARLSLLALKMFEYIDQQGILDSDWSPTYDEEGVFPLVLPSVGFYNLCNGSFGSIGVGLISSIPQFNLKEMNEAICKLIDDPDQIVDLVPDFASGGILMNPQTTQASLRIGEGKPCVMRGEIKKNKKEGWLEVISLPYGCFTDTLMKKLTKVYTEETKKAADKGKKFTLFTDFKDLSQEAVRVRVYGPDLDKIEQWLYKNTIVQNHYTIKLIMLDNGKVPKLFTLTEAILAHINHASAAYRRQYEFQLQKLIDREEIIRGLIAVRPIIDEVVQCIKASQSRTDAIANLVNQFNFTTRVSEAIVDLRLHRLTSMDILKLEKELESNLLEQERIQVVLNDDKMFKDELKAIYKDVANQFGDKRRTKVYEGEEYETDIDGATPTRDFYLAGSATSFWADTTDDGEIFESADDDKKESKVLVTLADDVIILSNTGRAFLRTAQEFKIGAMKWSTILPLKDDETIVGFWEKSTMPEFLLINGKKFHQSYLTVAASKRGKKFSTGKWDITEVLELQ